MQGERPRLRGVGAILMITLSGTGRELDYQKQAAPCRMSMFKNPS
jgi:hypothetical protein